MRLVLSLLVALASVTAASAAEPQQASIPFVPAGSLKDFRVVDQKVAYIQDSKDRWLRAEMKESCPGLESADAIRIESEKKEVFDRTSVIMVGGKRCALKSLVASDPPPELINDMPAEPARTDEAAAAKTPK